MSKGQKCCVPSCDPGSVSVRFFRPPVQKQHIVQSWKDLLSTSCSFEDFDPAVNWVCSKHFQDHFILKEDVVIENGVRISIPLTNWRLKDDAIPTIFEKPKEEAKNTSVISTSSNLDPEESTEKLKPNEEAETNDDIVSPSAKFRVILTDKIFEEKEGEEEELSEVEVEPQPILQKVVNKVLAKKKSKKARKKKKINHRPPPAAPAAPVVVGPGRKQVLISRVDLGDRIDNITSTNPVAEPPRTSIVLPTTVNISRLIARGRGRPLGTKKPPKKKVLGRGRGRPSLPAKIKPAKMEVSPTDTDKIWKPSSGLLLDQASTSTTGLSKGRPKRTIRSASWRPSGDNHELLSEEDDVMDLDTDVGEIGSSGPAHRLKCFIDACKHSPSANLYKCPLSDRKIITQWMKTIPQSNHNTFDVSQDVLCEKHFESKYFVNISTGTVLSNDAIPTWFEEKSLKRSLVTESTVSSAKMPKLQAEVDCEIDIPSPVSRALALGLRYYPRRGDHTEVIEREPTEISSNKNKVDTGSKSKSKGKSSIKATILLENGLPLEEDITPIPTPKPPPKPQEVLLKMGQAGYDLSYIFKVKEKFERPSINKWIFELMTDMFTKQQSIYIAELVSRNDELTFQRVIKIFQDLTFKVETNGIDVTSMFTELGTQIDTLTKLQEIMDDLSAFQVCQGWPGFKMVVDCEVGKKVGGIWYSKNCESLKLDRIRCQPCSSIANALRVRKTKILRILQKAETSIQNQLLLLPPDDPLRLQIQIQELIEERNKLKKELLSKNVKEVRLQKNFKVLTNNLHQGQTVRVKVVPRPTPAPKSNQIPGPSSQRQKIANNNSNVAVAARTPTSTTIIVPHPAPLVRKKPGPLSRTAVGITPTSTSKPNNISTVRTSSSTTTVQKNTTAGNNNPNNTFGIQVLQSEDVIQPHPTISTAINSEATNISTSSETIDGSTVSSLAPIHTFDHSDTLLINNITEILPSTSITFPSESLTPSTSTTAYFLLPGSVTALSPQQYSVEEYTEDPDNEPFNESDVITLL